MEKQITENKDKEQQTERGNETSSTEISTKIMENKVDSKKEVMIDQQTERDDETSSTETPTTELPLPPRFKYMEKQFKQDGADLGQIDAQANKDEEKGMTEQQTERDDETSSTEVSTKIMENKDDSKKEVMIDQQTERGDETSSTETPTTELSLPPRFKYMEKQFKQDAGLGQESTEIDAQKDAIVVTEVTTGSHNDKDLVEDVTVGDNEDFKVFDIREDFNPGFHGIVKKK